MWDKVWDCVIKSDWMHKIFRRKKALKNLFINNLYMCFREIINMRMFIFWHAIVINTIWSRLKHVMSGFTIMCYK